MRYLLEDFPCTQVDLRIPLEEIIEDFPYLFFRQRREDVHPGKQLYLFLFVHGQFPTNSTSSRKPNPHSVSTSQRVEGVLEPNSDHKSDHGTNRIGPGAPCTCSWSGV